MVAEQPLVEVVELPCAGDRGTRPHARVVPFDGVAADEKPGLVVLPADEHVEVDVGDAVALAQTPRSALELGVQEVAHAREIFETLRAHAGLRLRR